MSGKSHLPQLAKNFQKHSNCFWLMLDLVHHAGVTSTTPKKLNNTKENQVLSKAVVAVVVVMIMVVMHY